MSNTISAQTGTMNLLPGEVFNVTPLLDSLITLQGGSLNFTLSNVAVATGQIDYALVSGQPTYYYFSPGTLATAGQLTDTISFTATDNLGDSANDTVNVTTNDSEQWTNAVGNNDPTNPGNWEQQVSGSFTLPGYVPDANTTADVVDFTQVGGVGTFLPVSMTLPTGENLSVGQVSAVDLAFSNAGTFNIGGSIGPFLTSFANSGTINGINGQFYDSGAADNYGTLNIAGSLAVAYGTMANPGGAGGSVTLDNHAGASIVAAPTAAQPNAQLTADNIDNAGTIDLATPGSTDLTTTGNGGYGVATNEAGGLVEMQGGSNFVNVGALLNQGSFEMDCSGSGGPNGTSYLNVGALSGASTLPGGLAFDNESQIALTGGADSTVEIFGGGVNNGSVTESAGSYGLTCLTSTGTLTNNGAWTMNSGDAGEFDPSTLINNGSISLSGKEFSIFTNQFTNTATGTVSLSILPGEGSYQATFETPVTNDGEIDIAANSTASFEGATNGSADAGSIHLAAGATLEVANGAWGWTVSTGSIGANQSIWLDGGDDSIEIGNFPDNTIAAPIHGFAEGDTIVLRGESFLDVGLNYNQTTDMLTVNLAGGGTQTFQFASPIPAADHFVALPDPAAGAEIVLAPALGILDLAASQTGTDTALNKPFASAMLEDVNAGATLTLTITLDNPANGVLTDLSGGSYDPASGVYTITGGLQQLSGALSQLSFLATAGGSATTNFTVSVSDGSYGNTATASTSLAVAGAAGDVPPPFMLAPGDVFTAPVNAQAYGLTTLDLLPGTGAALSGLGSNFVGFATIDVQTGANWQLTGSNTLTAGESITGGGTLSVAAGATLATCANGGETISNAVILNDGTMEISVNDPTVISASLSANSGDNGLVDIMAGGSLEFDGSVAASQTIAFTADSGRLTIADPAQFLASVAGLRQGDAIDFSSFAWGSVSGVSTATPGEIVLSLTGGGSYSLALAAGANLSQTTLALGNDGHGGTGLYFGSAATTVNLSGYDNTVAGPTVVVRASGVADAAPVEGPPFGNWNYTGSADNIAIVAQGYNNTIVAGGGDDTINAGLGGAKVTVSNADGDNTVGGGNGFAAVTLGNGDNTVGTGGYGNVIALGNGDNTVSAGVGLEQVTLGNGDNSVVASGSGNSIAVGDGDNTVVAGGSDDSVTVLGGTAAITATGYDDSFTIDGGNVAISGIVGLASVTLGAGFGAGGIDFTGFSGNLVQVGGAWALERADGEVYASFFLPTGKAVQAAADGHGGTLITMVAAGSGGGGSGGGSNSGGGITETSGGQTIALDDSTTTLRLWGYYNHVSSASGGYSISGDDGYSTFNLAGDDNTLLLGGTGDAIDIGVDALGHSIATGGNTISGTVGSTSVVVGNGDQIITLGGYYNHVATGVGDGAINAGVGYSTVTVAGGDNAITVTGNQNTIATGAGSDTVQLGNGWNNTIDAGSGAATVTGGYGNTYVAGVGTLDVTDFNAAYGDVLDLTSLETALGVTGSAFSVAADTTTPTSLDVFVAHGGSTSLVATLGGTHGTLASLEASHSILA